MRVIATFDELTGLLREDGVVFQADAASERIEIPVSLGSRTTALHIDWHSQGNLVQLVHPLPFQVPTERMSAVESAIVRLNHAIAVPGFGMNHASRFAYYRLVASRDAAGALDADEVRRLCHVVASTARDYGHLLLAVALDGDNAEEALLQAIAEPKHMS